ncbi:hypothetical protein BT69DRAFT_1384078 [Atractiella rhizophila]|nr:hypothetical protein BT69DRAFT_1384078 [Atractiella rhizophila]
MPSSSTTLPGQAIGAAYPNLQQIESVKLTMLAKQWQHLLPAYTNRVEPPIPFLQAQAFEATYKCSACWVYLGVLEKGRHHNCSGAERFRNDLKEVIVRLEAGEDPYDADYVSPSRLAVIKWENNLIDPFLSSGSAVTPPASPASTPRKRKREQPFSTPGERDRSFNRTMASLQSKLPKYEHTSNGNMLVVAFPADPPPALRDARVLTDAELREIVQNAITITASSVFTSDEEFPMFKNLIKGYVTQKASAYWAKNADEAVAASSAMRAKLTNWEEVVMNQDQLRTGPDAPGSSQESP